MATAEETGLVLAPKEQPPRKLSGKRTASGVPLWRAAAQAFAPLTEGGKPVRQTISLNRSNLSGSLTDGVVLDLRSGVDFLSNDLRGIAWQIHKMMKPQHGRRFMIVT